MQIAMIGSGYVGLVSGTCFSEFGHDVTCVDKDGDKIARLRDGEVPIFEPGLDPLIAQNRRLVRIPRRPCYVPARSSQVRGEDPGAIPKSKAK